MNLNPNVRWTYEPEYLSAQRKQKTGRYHVMDDAGDFICTVGNEQIARFIAAGPELALAAWQATQALADARSALELVLAKAGNLNG